MKDRQTIYSAIFFCVALLAVSQDGRCDPDQARLFFEMGVARADSGRDDAALRAFEMAADLDPNMSSAHVNIGVIRKKRGESRAAVRSFEETIRLSPFEIFAYLELADLHATAGRLDEAEDILRRGVHVTPEGSYERANANFNLGTVLLWQGEYEEAEANLRRTTESSRLESERLWDDGWRLIRRGPGPALVNFSLGTAMLLKGLWGKIFTPHPAFPSPNPIEPKAHFNLGWIFVAQGRLEEARAEYARAVASDTSYLQAMCALGDVYLRLGRNDAAQEAFEGALRVASENPWATYGLGNAMLRQGRIEEGREILQRFKDLNEAVVEEVKREMMAVPQ